MMIGGLLQTGDPKRKVCVPPSTCHASPCQMYTEWNLGPHHKVLLELGEKEIALRAESGECRKQGRRFLGEAGPLHFI